MHGKSITASRLIDLPVNRDLLLYSFPKCGRTWLRYLFAHIFGEHLAAEHEPKPEWGEQLKIILIRDLRDVIVSYYFEVKHRPAGFGAIGPVSETLISRWKDSDRSISAFVRLGTIEAYLDSYARFLSLGGERLIVAYEDLHRDPAGWLRPFCERVCANTRLGPVTQRQIMAAVAACSFENMHSLEARNQGLPGVFRDGTWLPNLKPGNPDNPDSFKTRRGTVGSFSQYLSESDLRHVRQSASAHPVYRQLAPKILRD